MEWDAIFRPFHGGKADAVFQLFPRRCPETPSTVEPHGVRGGMNGGSRRARPFGCAPSASGPHPAHESPSGRTAGKDGCRLFSGGHAAEAVPFESAVPIEGAEIFPVPNEVLEGLDPSRGL